MAVSADTSRRLRTTSLIRFPGTPIAWARALAERPRGFKYSLARISPGCVRNRGMRRSFNDSRRPRPGPAAFGPNETHTPFVINADAELTGPVGLQGNRFPGGDCSAANVCA